jgi:hypothetical protein
MTINVSPTTPNPTHHVQFTDADGNTIGLITTRNGEPDPLAVTRSPVDRTAMKISQGNSEYGDLEPPYFAVAQQDWAGGLGNEELSKNAAAYYEAHNANTSRSGKVFAGPEAVLLRDDDIPMNWPATSLKWQSLGNAIAQKITIGADCPELDIESITLIAKRLTASATPGNITVHIQEDDGGAPSGTDSGCTFEATIAEELAEMDVYRVCAYATDYENLPHIDVAESTVLWIVIDTSTEYQVGLNEDTGDAFLEFIDEEWTAPAGDWRMVFVLNPLRNYSKVNLFMYRGMPYFTAKGPTGKYVCQRIGDRGAADDNTDHLDQLIDATQSWTVDEYAGAIVEIIGGEGFDEPVRRWRTIVSNTATELIVDEPWTIVHSETSTKYVIYGVLKTTNAWGEDKNLTKITDVLAASSGHLYIATGEEIYIYHEYIDTDAWDKEGPTEFGTNNQAVYLCETNNHLWRSKGNNPNVSKCELKAEYADPDPAFGDDIKCGDIAYPITGLEKYIDGSGLETLWVLKEEDAGFAKASEFTSIDVRELISARDSHNGRAHLVHGTYLYFGMGTRVQRYYKPQLDDLGPSHIPDSRIGYITKLRGYPGKVFAISQAAERGKTFYSTILMYDGGGWHEFYRAPNGVMIEDILPMVIPGDNPDWLLIAFSQNGATYAGNIGYIPLPSHNTDPTKDSHYAPQAPCFSFVTSQVDIAMKDIDKYAGRIKVVAECLPGNIIDASTPQTIYVDYMDNDPDEPEIPLRWENLGSVTLTQNAGRKLYEISAGDFGINARSFSFRLRAETKNADIQPVVYAFVVELIGRVSPKFAYSIPFIVTDDAIDLNGRGDDTPGADAKMALLDGWTGAGILRMNSVNPLHHGKSVFALPMTMREIGWDDTRQKRRYLGTMVVQDA